MRDGYTEVLESSSGPLAPVESHPRTCNNNKTKQCIYTSASGNPGLIDSLCGTSGVPSVGMIFVIETGRVGGWLSGSVESSVQAQGRELSASYLIMSMRWTVYRGDI
jgi:hypothetical protein